MTKEELIALKVDPKLHEDPTLKEIKDIPTALQVLVDTKSFVGRSIRIPSDSASAEERAAFRKDLQTKIPTLIDLPADAAELATVEDSIFEKFGRPKDEKGYQPVKEIVKELPEGVQFNEDEIRAIGRKLGLTKKQYAEFAKGVVEERVRAHNAGTEAMKALRKELGDATDDRLASAAMAAKKLGAGDELVAAIRKGTLPAEQVRLYVNAAKAMGTEPGEFGAAGGGGKYRLTPDEAKMQIEELRRNSALNDPHSPAHDAAVNKLLELNRAAYPEEQ